MRRNNFNSIEELARRIIEDNKKISLYYAFNGIGKTRLSMEFKGLVEDELEHPNIIYYNSFIEDLFVWDNSDADNSIFKIEKNSEFFRLLSELGQENNIIEKFQEFTKSKLEPNFDLESGEITFKLPRGNDIIENIKISRGEESIFIWSIFLILLDTIISELNIQELEDRTTDFYNNIKYIFIDDPMSSLDDNNIIEVAISLKELIKKSTNIDLRFIITTHHALFYNVLYNEINRDGDIRQKEFCILKRNGDNYIKEINKDTIFGYHLFVKSEIERAILENSIERYHFTLFRNLLEKTATFLGYQAWGDLITEEDISEDERKAYIRRINLYSHNRISDLESQDLKEHEKAMLRRLFENFKNEFKWKE